MNFKSHFFAVAVVLALVACGVSGQTQIGANINGEHSDDQSGSALSMNAAGDIIAIAAQGNDDTGSNAGQVRVFQDNGGTWVQLGQDIDGEAGADLSGWSVSLNAAGDRVAIGAIFNDGGGSDSGHTRVYEFNGSSWTQLGANINGAAGSDRFGSSVALNDAGDIVAIGAYLNDAAGSQAGHVRVFAYDGSNWVQQGPAMQGQSSGDYFGWSLDINAAGNIVAVGAHEHSNRDGHVLVFQYTGGNWVQVGADIESRSYGSRAGYDVALSASGNTVVIGAYSGANVGQAYVMELDGGSWVQVGSTLLGPSGGSRFGYSVDINNAGNAIVVGSPAQMGGAYTYVYNETTLAWVQAGTAVQGTALGNQFGHAVTMNAAGDTIAVGSYMETGNAYRDGVVRVYDVPVPTTSASVSGDPHFNGFRGQRFEFQGEHGEVYNLLSSLAVQVNARFVANSQWGDSRTFMDAVAVQDLSSRVSVSCLNGSLSTIVNGITLNTGAVSAGDLSVVVEKKAVLIQTTLGDVSISHAKNRWTSCYLNAEFTISSGEDPDHVHGLIGQTARINDQVAASSMTKYTDGVFEIQGVDADYRIAEGHLFGKSFRFNLFAGQQ